MILTPIPMCGFSRHIKLFLYKSWVLGDSAQLPRCLPGGNVRSRSTRALFHKTDSPIRHQLKAQPVTSAAGATGCSQSFPPSLSSIDFAAAAPRTQRNVSLTRSPVSYERCNSGIHRARGKAVGLPCSPSVALPQSSGRTQAWARNGNRTGALAVCRMMPNP